MAKQNQKGITLDQFKDKYIGKPGTPDRDQYEFDLKMEILGEMIKKTRKGKKHDPRRIRAINWGQQIRNIQT